MDTIEETIRSKVGANFVVHFAGREDASLGSELLAALRRGDIVAVQGDRPRMTGRAVTVRLFDRPFPIPDGPAALARVAEVPLLPVFVFREGRLRSRLVLREPVTVAASSRRNEAIGAAAQQTAAQIEWAIRQRPHQWFCFRTLWPRRENSAS